MKRLLVLTLAVAGVLAAGCLVRFGTLDKDTNDFVGLASNLTNVDVVAASVQVDFLNSSGTVIDTENVNPCTRTLQKHKDSPVEASAPSSLDARSVKTTVRPLTFGTRDVADLDVDEDNINITSTADEDTTDITGTIDANEDLQDPHVCAAFFDNDGNVIAVGHDFSIDDVDDGNSVDFDVAVDTSNIDINDIDHYELWIDALHSSNVRAPDVIGPNDVNVEATATPTKTKTPTPGPSATPTPVPPTITPTPI